MMVDSAVEMIDARLREAGTVERAEAEKRYLRSDLEHYGVRVPAIRAIAKAFLKSKPHLDHDDLVRVVEELWQRPVHECRFAAVELLVQRQVLLEPADTSFIERLVREARTWALVDPLAVYVAGSLLQRHQEADAVLDRWAADDDFWVRRTALLVHLKPLVSGSGDFDRFGRYADAMLEETEFLIRKAIGWILRDTARKRPHMVYEWIAPRTHRASGVTIREVVKRLPPEEAEAVRVAYQARRPVE